MHFSRNASASRPRSRTCTTTTRARWRESGEEAVFDNHLADTATDTYDRELDYTLEENAEHVLGDIDAALKRIESGTYGTCTKCGHPIPQERLEARPWATLCIGCQRERERR